MEKTEKLASSKKSEDVSGDRGSRVLVPLELATLNKIAALLKEGPKSTNIEDALKMDPHLLGFLKDNFHQGTELLEDHNARKKRAKISVAEDSIMLDVGGDKTKVDETTTVGMLQELDEAEATDVGSDQSDDDEMDGDDVNQEYVRDNHFPIEEKVTTFSPIERVTHEVVIEFLAKEISNSKDLIDISDKLMENLQKADVSIAQHFVLVSQFWENEHFLKALYGELDKNVSLFCCMDVFVKLVVIENESNEERVNRIRKDPAIEKLLDEKDRVVIMRGILGIIFGYWIEKENLVALAKKWEVSDEVPQLVKNHLVWWSSLM